MSSREIFLPPLHADGHQMGESLLKVIRGIFAVRKDHKTGENAGEEKLKNEKTEYGYKRAGAGETRSRSGQGGRRWRREQLPKQNLF